MMKYLSVIKPMPCPRRRPNKAKIMPRSGRNSDMHHNSIELILDSHLLQRKMVSKRIEGLYLEVGKPYL